MSRCVILSACPVQPELKRLLRSEAEGGDRS